MLKLPQSRVERNPVNSSNKRRGYHSRDCRVSLQKSLQKLANLLLIAASVASLASLCGLPYTHSVGQNTHSVGQSPKKEERFAISNVQEPAFTLTQEQQRFVRSLNLPKDCTICAIAKLADKTSGNLDKDFYNALVKAREDPWFSKSESILKGKYHLIVAQFESRLYLILVRGNLEQFHERDNLIIYDVYNPPSDANSLKSLVLSHFALDGPQMVIERSLRDFLANQNWDLQKFVAEIFDEQNQALAYMLDRNLEADFYEIIYSSKQNKLVRFSMQLRLLERLESYSKTLGYGEDPKRDAAIALVIATQFIFAVQENKVPAETAQKELESLKLLASKQGYPEHVIEILNVTEQCINIAKDIYNKKRLVNAFYTQLTKLADKLCERPMINQH
jgi:hypothetical protein